jgi:hypothetical protein
MSDGTRHANAQSPKALRFSELRRLNYTDPRGFNAQQAHILYWTHDADGQPVAVPTQVPATEAAAAFGAPFKVLGYERLSLLIDAVKGAMTDVNVLVQAGHLNSVGADFWYDVYEGAYGTLTRGVITRPLTVDTQFATVIDTCGVFMRFKVWGTNADAASFARVQAVRHMDSI